MFVYQRINQGIPSWTLPQFQGEPFTLSSAPGSAAAVFLFSDGPMVRIHRIHGAGVLKIPMDENGRYSPPYMDGIGMYKDIYIGVHHLDVMNF